MAEHATRGPARREQQIIQSSGRDRNSRLLCEWSGAAPSLPTHDVEVVIVVGIREAAVASGDFEVCALGYAWAHPHFPNADAIWVNTQDLDRNSGRMVEPDIADRWGSYSRSKMLFKT